MRHEEAVDQGSMGNQGNHANRADWGNQANKRTKRTKKDTDRRGLFILLCVGAFVLCFAGGAASKLLIQPSWAKDFQVDWSDAVGTERLDIAYGNGAANKFDLYLPADKGKGAYGLVAYLHPGGFTAGDKAGDADMCRWLCSLGYVSASISYTLFSDDNPLASVKSQTEEIRDAIPVVVEAARENGYPIDAMAIGGGSAGGCLALVYAYRDAGEAPVPLKCIFEAVGPASMRVEDWTNYGLDQNAEAAASLLGVRSGAIAAGEPITPQEIESGAYLEKVRAVSAADLVTSDAPPTLMAYGMHDTVCPYPSSVRLDARLTELGVPHDYIVLPHSGHGLQNDDDLYREYMEKVQEYLRKYLG